jgi:hypothetical protein
MSEFVVPTDFLIGGWFGVQKLCLPPKFSVLGQQIKIVAFQKGGAGMRVSHYNIEQKVDKEIGFEVPDALRCFIKKLSVWPMVKFSIQNESLTISVEGCTSAISYTFPKLNLFQDDYIPDHEKDEILQISTVEWFNIWNTIPIKGKVTLKISKQTKVITLEHSKSRWKAAIIAKSKPSKDTTIVVDSGVAKSVFVDPDNRTFSELIFKHAGLIHWRSRDLEIYVAPAE